MPLSPLAGEPLGGNRYKEYYGRLTDQMPTLLAAGREPLSVTDLLRRRVEALALERRVRDAWWDYDFDTGDAVCLLPDGSVTIVLDAPPLRCLTPRTRLRQGALVLSPSAYDRLEGPTFSAADLSRHIGRPLDRREAQTHPIWVALTRDDRPLLREYVDVLFDRLRREYPHNEETAMGIHILSPPQQQPTLRAVRICDYFGRYSYALGGNCLNSPDGRLIGVQAREP